MTDRKLTSYGGSGFSYEQDGKVYDVDAHTDKQNSIISMLFEYDFRRVDNEFLEENGFYPDDENVHHLFHKMTDAVDEWKEENPGVFGYKLMKFMEDTVNNDVFLRNHVTVAYVDDDSHASSVVFLVPHYTNYRYMGTSVWYVPQCTGEEDIRFFLYPGAHREMIRALNLIVEKYFDEGYPQVKSPMDREIDRLKGELLDTVDGEEQ